MGETDRYQDYRMSRRRRFTLGQPGNALFNLVAANLGAFFVIILVNVFTFYSRQGLVNDGVNAVEYFALPANLITLTERPWTLLTFMFAQGGISPWGSLFTMAANMLWLWTFGYILQELSGNRYIFPIYIYGSILGAILFLVFANSVPALRSQKNDLFLYSALYGSSAIATAVAILEPNYRVFKNFGKGMPVWILTVVYLLINILFVNAVSTALSIALLGAAAAGFLFIYFLRKGKDFSAWMHNLYNWASGLFNPNRNANSADREKVFYNTAGRPPYNKTSNVTQQRIDEILDKINQRGYQFLTDDEKNILKRASEEDI
jgi:membrane associated rhomboid family serine protease